MSPAYFEDLEPYQKYRSRGYNLKEEEIIDFAKVWDPRPFHTNPELAKNTRLGGLFASGAHLVSIWYKLSNERDPILAAIAGLGWEKVQFITPARPGDILILEEEVLWKRVSKSDPNAGIMHAAAKLFNQREEVVFSMEGTALIEKRPANSSQSVVC